MLSSLVSRAATLRVLPAPPAPEVRYFYCFRPAHAMTPGCFDVEEVREADLGDPEFSAYGDLWTATRGTVRAPQTGREATAWTVTLEGSYEYVSVTVMCGHPHAALLIAVAGLSVMDEASKIDREGGV